MRFLVNFLVSWPMGQRVIVNGEVKQLPKVFFENEDKARDIEVCLKWYMLKG